LNFHPSTRPSNDGPSRVSCGSCCPVWLWPEGAANHDGSAAAERAVGGDSTPNTRADDFPSAFAAIRGAHPDGLLIAVEPLIGAYAAQVLAFAAAARIPAIYDDGAMARRGGLMAYATKYVEHYPIAAEYVDRILKGEGPANLPVQQPARFELVINRNTADALGLRIPESLLQRADEVVQ